MSDKIMLKCPACGHIIGRPYIPNREIEELMNKRASTVRQTLQQIREYIRQNIPAESKTQSRYKFIQSISAFSDEEVMYGCRMYLGQKHYLKGKGWHYLAAIIKNFNKNHERKASNEEKMIGSIPIKRSIE